MSANGIGLLDQAPYPQNDPLVFVNKKGEGYVNEQQWGNWLLALQNSVNAAPVRLGAQVTLSGQNAAIAAADLAAGQIVSGDYSLAYWLRVSLPAGVTSDAQVTFTWTSGGVTQTFVGTLVNGNLTTSYASQSVPLFRPDDGTPITYAVAYNSNPAAAMQFELDVVLSRVQVTTGT